jgi:hypothetical protein
MITNITLKNVTVFKHLGMIVKNQIAFMMELREDKIQGMTATISSGSFVFPFLL